MKIFCWCQSLIQFYVNGQGCVSSLLFDQRPNYGGGNENNGDLLQKVPCTHCYTQWPQLCSRPPPTNASTRDSWTFTGTLVSLLCVNCSFLLGSGAHKVLFVPSKSLFPQSCVSSGSSMVGLMAYALPRSTAPRAPAPVAVHYYPYLLRDTQTQFCLSLWGDLWVLVHTRYVWALWASLAGMGFDSKCNFAPPTILLGLLCPWT